MCTRPRVTLTAALSIAAFLFGVLWSTSRSQAAGPPQAVKSPLSPEESVKTFRLAPELRIEIVAAEPQVVSPVSIAFDEEGRLWVVEMSDYPNGPVPGEPPRSRIKLLEDRDADGRFETAHLFADKLLFATGLQPWRGGVVVTLAGEIAYFKDTDGDHKADVRETWFRGFVQENPQLRANHPRFAIDNHIYVANGLRGGTIVADAEKWGREIPPVPISGKDFRFDPLTGECEAVSGNGQFGLTFDDFGNRFVCSNRNPCRHVVLEGRYLKRNPFLAVRDVCQDVSPPAENSRVFPVSRAWTTSNLHAGQFTAACGVLIYRGDALPKAEYYGNSFVCEPTGNLVHRDILEADGPTFKSHYAQEGVEFLASPDEWFRPVDLANGPDGALYVVDMYRAVIEHPDWVPAELKNRPDLYDGSDRGRIYRMVAKAKSIDAARRGSLKLGALPTSDLAQVIEHPNAWQRETAARLLFERQEKSVAGDLERIVRNRGAPAAARAQALHLAEALSAVPDDLLVSLATDTDLRLRDQAILLSEPRLRSSRTLFDAVLRDSVVTLQAALSWGELDLPSRRDSGAWERLATLLVDHPENEWYRRAALSSATDSGLDLLIAITQVPEYVRSFPKMVRFRRLIEDVYEIVGTSGENSQITFAVRRGILGTLSRRDPDEVLGLAFAAWHGLARGLGRRGESLRDTVKMLENGEDQDWITETLRVLTDDAIRLAEDSGADLALRVEAVRFLQYVAFHTAQAHLLKLIQSDPLQEIRLAAVDALAARDETEVREVLVAALAAQTPAVRRRLFQSLLQTTARAEALLAEVQSGKLTVTELDPATVQLLINHKTESLREQARKLLAAAIPADRKQVLEKYRPALDLKADARLGKAVFEKNCVTCHKIGDLGVNVAPDISDSRTKMPAQLLTDILNPNQAIDNNYVSYTVLTKDGKTETGIVSTETASSITLRQAEGKTVLILRQEIEELKSNGISLMPEGLEKNITVEQMADLISFIKNWRYLDGAVPVGND